MGLPLFGKEGSGTPVFKILLKALGMYTRKQWTSKIDKICFSCGCMRLGPSINGLVTDGNTKLCCQGFILALFRSNTANKIDSEHTQDDKRLLPVCEAEILQVTVKMKFSHLFMLISEDFWLKVPKIAKGYLDSLLMFI